MRDWELLRERMRLRLQARQNVRAVAEQAVFPPLPARHVFDETAKAARDRREQAEQLRRWECSPERLAGPNVPLPHLPDRDTPPRLHKVKTSGGKLVTIGPTVVTDPATDKDATLGAALAGVATRAKGAGKQGWFSFIPKMGNVPLSTRVSCASGALLCHGTSKAAKLLMEAWETAGNRISGATVRRHLRRLHELRLTMPKW